MRSTVDPQRTPGSNLGRIRPVPFLTADWLNVAAITFAVEEERLRPYLPHGATIDSLEGVPRLSLVAFEFRRTRVRGLAIPGHIDFPEINLRFYVRHRGERGVVFIRELVPRRAIATIARLLYNEPYQRVPMTCGADPVGDGVRVWHRFGRGSSLSVEGAAGAVVPEVGSAAHWLTDHSLGRRPAARRPHRPLQRRAPDMGAARGHRMSRSTSTTRALYGPEWAWLRDATPSHLSLAVGSPITVSRPLPA